MIFATRQHVQMPVQIRMVLAPSQGTSAARGEGQGAESSIGDAVAGAVLPNNTSVNGSEYLDYGKRIEEAEEKLMFALERGKWEEACKLHVALVQVSGCLVILLLGLESVSLTLSCFAVSCRLNLRFPMWHHLTTWWGGVGLISPGALQSS